MDPPAPTTNVHVNPNFKGNQRGSTTSAVHLNPKFASSSGGSGGGGGVHVNPNFRPRSPAKSPVKSANSSVHINPKFANRPLPEVPAAAAPNKSKSTPHVNPKFLPDSGKVAIDSAKRDGYHEAVARSVAGKVFVNPKFSSAAQRKPESKTVYVDPSLVKMKKEQQRSEKRKVGGSPGSEKENHPSAAVSASPRQRKSVFKKIGNKKLIRVRKDSLSSSASSVSATPPSKRRKNSGEFRKIGTKKLVRVNKKGTPPVSRKSPRNVNNNSSWRSRLYRTPQNNGGRKRSAILRLVTPLSLRKVKISPPNRRTSKSMHVSPGKGKRRHMYRVFNPFKVDRRKHKTLKSPIVSSTTPARNLSPKTPKSVPPPKPLRTSLLQTPVAAPRPEETVINIQGTKYKISANGKTLNRVDEGKSSSASAAPPGGITRSSVNPARASLMSRKIFLEGEEFVAEEDQPGVLVRSRNSMTRASITNARNRSINTILKSQARSKQYCMFFNKFGRCNKRDKGVCPYIHDPDKVAVCRRFLQGLCVKENCLLSHKVAPEKMPSCKFFLEDICTRENCPYRHVKVNPNADICPEYLKGYCSAGQDCKRRHVSRCPQFEKTGVCARGKRCPYPHAVQKGPATTVVATPSKRAAKTPPPPKPKRKSIGSATVDSKKARMRYFEDVQEKSDNDDPVEDAADLNPEATPALSGAMEAKRKRLLRKVELAKQGWSGASPNKTRAEEDEGSDKGSEMDDSGPYEEIDEGDDGAEDTAPQRAPLGDLPAFIPLETKDSDKEGEETFEERLI